MGLKSGNGGLGLHPELIQSCCVLEIGRTIGLGTELVIGTVIDTSSIVV
jgi:hypothetical protein